MCKIGDIILIQKYKAGGKEIGRHSFVVIEDRGGEIKGLAYDFVCNALSSFKDKEQRRRKLSYPGNMPKKQRKLIAAWAALHQEELLANWELAMNEHALYSIEPLR